MTFFGPDLRNGLPIGLGSVAGFGIAPQFSPASLFLGGTVNGAWYDPSDSTTLFSDRAGTTPCGTPGGGSVVPVGAMLDKRAAGYSVFFDGTGDFLSCASSAVFGFGTGNFTVEFWVYPTTLSGAQVIVDFRTTNPQIAPMIYTNGASLRLFVNGSDVINIASALTVNVWQHVALVKNNNSTQFYINGIASGSAYSDTNNYVSPAPFRIGTYFGQDGVFFAGYLSNVRVVVGTAVYTGNFTPSGPLSPISGTSLLTCGTSWTGNPAITKNGDARVDGLNPFTASPVGNHAIAANDTTARPELRARVNLLTYSEQFDNAAWTTVGGVAVVVANQATAPNGTLTADLLRGNGAYGYQWVYANNITGSAGTVYTISVFAKAAGYNWLWLGDVSGGGQIGSAYFNLQTGAIGTVTAGITATMVSVGNGWYRCSITGPSPDALISPSMAFTSADNTPVFTANNTDGIYIWGAQLTATNEFPANTYQRISDANTYDAVGFPRYLAFNGTSSAMSTPGNVNLSGTDKATVFAGVRKLSDAALGILAELSAVANSNNGSFAVAAPGWSPVASRYGALFRATVDFETPTSPASFSSPISNVLSYAFDTSNVVQANRTKLRVNAADQTLSYAFGPTTPGGNFGSYPLFIGSRNNASTFLNGNIYSLIVVGSAVSAGQISATEQWVAGKVGITI